jgi:hypothetical protein
MEKLKLRRFDIPSYQNTLKWKKTSYKTVPFYDCILQGLASCLEPIVAVVKEVDSALGGNGAVLAPSGGLKVGLDHGLDDIVELVRGDRDGGLDELERGGVGGHALRLRQSVGPPFTFGALSLEYIL